MLLVFCLQLLRRNFNENKSVSDPSPILKLLNRLNKWQIGSMMMVGKNLKHIFMGSIWKITIGCKKPTAFYML